MRRTVKTEKELYRKLPGRKVTTITYDKAGESIEIPVRLDEYSGMFSCVVASEVLQSDRLMELRDLAITRANMALSQQWHAVVFVLPKPYSIDFHYAFRSDEKIECEPRRSWKERQCIKDLKMKDKNYEPPKVIEHLYIRALPKPADEGSEVPFELTRRGRDGTEETPVRRAQLAGWRKEDEDSFEIEATPEVLWAIHAWEERMKEYAVREKAITKEKHDNNLLLAENLTTSGSLVHAIHSALAGKKHEDVELPPADEGGA